MAEAAVTAVLTVLFDNIFNKLRSVFGNEFRSIQGGLSEDLDRLSTTLSKFQHVLRDAEVKDFKSAATRDWLRRLKYVANEADGILDDAMDSDSDSDDDNQTRVFNFEDKDSILPNLKKISRFGRIALPSKKKKHKNSNCLQVQDTRSSIKIYSRKDYGSHYFGQTPRRQLKVDLLGYTALLIGIIGANISSCKWQGLFVVLLVLVVYISRNAVTYTPRPRPKRRQRVVSVEVQYQSMLAQCHQSWTAKYGRVYEDNAENKNIQAEYNVCRRFQQEGREQGVLVISTTIV